LERAALKVARPHRVGGCVLRMPTLGEPENPWFSKGKVNDGKVDKVFKVVPTCGCHRRVRRERLLGAVSVRWLTHPGLAGFPTLFTVHPEVSIVSVGLGARDQIQAPNIKGPVMSDKSPRQTMTKKTGKSLKEKRAAKRTKADNVSSTEAVLHPTKKR